MTTLHPSASYSVTIRVETHGVPGTLGRITSAIGEVGGVIGAIEIVSLSSSAVVRDITIAAGDAGHEHVIVQRVEQIEGVRVTTVSDRTFRVHLGGKIEVNGRFPLKTRDDLSMVYTPGVARVCTAIVEDPSKHWDLTIKGHTIAVVSDGTAVLGLGDIGPAGAQPVMEGKCMIFKAFAGVDAFPICLATTDTEEIIATVRAIAPVFGGINLEDISAPRCFEIEHRLRELLDIPVMHDDQHGTAIVVLAALKNALLVVGKELGSVKVVISGAGAAGVATARLLAAAGVGRVILADRAGAIYRGRVENMNPSKEALARDTNPDNEQGSLADVLRGADVFVGVSGPGLVAAEAVAAMAPNPIVFALANPVPEILPEELVGIARVVATGRSDYANQINNSLAFPGVFRGALDVRASDINQAMKLAAADAIAGLVAGDELCEEYIVPGMFDQRVAEAVSAAVHEAAVRTGVARSMAEGGRAAVRTLDSLAQVTTG